MSTRSANKRQVTWDREKRRSMAEADNKESVIPGHRQRAYSSMGEAATEWNSGMATQFWHEIPMLNNEMMECLGIPVEGMEIVY